MQFPRIHLNGSHGPTLLDQYCNAIHALHDAQAALRAIDVNNRDYYVISADAGNVAMAEHRARCAAIENLMSEINKIAESISDQL
jgi:hypothetical protein